MLFVLVCLPCVLTSPAGKHEEAGCGKGKREKEKEKEREKRDRKKKRERERRGEKRYINMVLIYVEEIILHSL